MCERATLCDQKATFLNQNATFPDQVWRSTMKAILARTSSFAGKKKKKQQENITMISCFAKEQRKVAAGKSRIHIYIYMYIHLLR